MYTKPNFGLVTTQQEVAYQCPGAGCNIQIKPPIEEVAVA